VAWFALAASVLDSFLNLLWIRRTLGRYFEGAPEDEFHIAENERISPGYFHAMGIPLREGRAIRHIHRKNWIAPDRKLRYLS
jgi:hypothetical protein